MGNYLRVAILFFLLSACNPVHPEMITSTLIAPTFTVPLVDTPNQSPASTALDVVLPTPSSVPGTSPTPTMNTTLQNLKSQLVFSYGGSAPYLEMTDCKAELSKLNSPLPAISTGYSPDFGPHYGIICIFGLKVEDSLQVTLTTPDKQKTYTGIYNLSEPSGDDSYYLDQTEPVYNDYDGELSQVDGVPVIQIDVIWSPELQPGLWQVTAISGSLEVSDTIDVQWPDDMPLIFAQNEPSDPFTRPHDGFFNLGDHLFMASLYRLQPGQNLTIHGDNFPANQALPLAVYQNTHNLPEMLSLVGVLRLVQSEIVSTDVSGKFQANFIANPDFPPGDYMIGVISDTNSLEPQLPYIGVYIDTCPGSAASSLWVGDRISKNETLVYQVPNPDDIAIKIFAQPGVSSPSTGTLEPGEEALILNGPICLNKTVWWQVRSSNKIEGWVKENDGDIRLIAPITSDELLEQLKHR